MNIYKLKNRETVWGDYGSILLTGMAAHLERSEGCLQLECTGPYVPPLIDSGLGNIVITELTKDKLQSSGLLGIDFRCVIKKHIVDIDWRSWDLQADEPPFYPESGEPEDYILKAPHSELISNKLGNLWELVIATVGTFDQNSKYIEGKTGVDFFMADNRGYILLTEIAKAWIEENAGEWVVFNKV